MTEKVYLSEKRLYGHRLVEGARCWCGDKLIAAPQFVRKINDASSITGDIVTCVDFAHASFYLKDLKEGVQDQ